MDFSQTQEGGTAESSGIGELFDEKTNHLKDSHSEFLKLWDRLIDLEAQELQVYGIQCLNIVQISH